MVDESAFEEMEAQDEDDAREQLASAFGEVSDLKPRLRNVKESIPFDINNPVHMWRLFVDLAGDTFIAWNRRHKEGEG